MQLVNHLSHGTAVFNLTCSAKQTRLPSSLEKTIKRKTRQGLSMRSLDPKKQFTHLHIRMETADYLQLKNQAMESKVSIATFVISKLGLGEKIPSTLDLKIFKELFKCRNDLARLGNLFKLAIDQETYEEDELLKLFEVIESTNKKMRELIATCDQKVRGLE